MILSCAWHDSILCIILKNISWGLGQNTNLFADCSDFKFNCPSELFVSKRPDIVLIKGRKVWGLELIVCYETNTRKSCVYKQDRYKSLRSELKIDCEEFEIIYFEVTTLGFISNK